MISPTTGDKKRIGDMRRADDRRWEGFDDWIFRCHCVGSRAHGFDDAWLRRHDTRQKTVDWGAEEGGEPGKLIGSKVWYRVGDYLLVTWEDNWSGQIQRDLYEGTECGMVHILTTHDPHARIDDEIVRYEDPQRYETMMIKRRDGVRWYDPYTCYRTPRGGPLFDMKRGDRFRMSWGEVGEITGQGAKATIFRLGVKSDNPDLRQLTPEETRAIGYS